MVLPHEPLRLHHPETAQAHGGPAHPGLQPDAGRPPVACPQPDAGTRVPDLRRLPGTDAPHHLGTDHHPGLGKTAPRTGNVFTSRPTAPLTPVDDQTFRGNRPKRVPTTNSRENDRQPQTRRTPAGLSASHASRTSRDSSLPGKNLKPTRA